VAGRQGVGVGFGSGFGFVGLGLGVGLSLGLGLERFRVDTLRCRWRGGVVGWLGGWVVGWWVLERPGVWGVGRVRADALGRRDEGCRFRVRGVGCGMQGGGWRMEVVGWRRVQGLGLVIYRFGLSFTKLGVYI